MKHLRLLLYYAKKGVIPHPLIVNKLLRQLAQHTAQWLRSSPQQLIAHGKG